MKTSRSVTTLTKALIFSQFLSWLEIRYTLLSVSVGGPMKLRCLIAMEVIIKSIFDTLELVDLYKHTLSWKSWLSFFCLEQHWRLLVLHNRSVLPLQPTLRGPSIQWSLFKTKERILTRTFLMVNSKQSNLMSKTIMKSRQTCFNFRRI